MVVMSVRAKVRQDGALEIPKDAREELGLSPGDEIELEVRNVKEQEKNPLLDIIGIASGGPSDLAENHDKYLYGKDA